MVTMPKGMKHCEHGTPAHASMDFEKQHIRPQKHMTWKPSWPKKRGSSTTRESMENQFKKQQIVKYINSTCSSPSS